MTHWQKKRHREQRNRPPALMSASEISAAMGLIGGMADIADRRAFVRDMAARRGWDEAKIGRAMRLFGLEVGGD